MAASWQVLLIGGSSGVGKTLVAPQVAHRTDVACSQVDDFRLTIQRLTTPEQQPSLHYFVSTQGVWERSPEELCAGLVEVGKIVSWSLEIVIAHHVASGVPLVLEGDGIVPALAVQQVFAGLKVEKGQVRSVFLYEPDEDILYANAKGRNRGFDHVPLGEQQVQIRSAWLYGQWLRAEALRLGLPVIEARPWQTLADRIIEVIT